MILAKDFLSRLKLDFSNIEEVYSDFLNEYNVNNIDKTEVIFIDSFDFDGIEQSENLSKLSEYLEEKRNKVEWYNIDFYNHYIKTGRFAFSVLFNYQDNEFDKVCDLLLKYKEQYDYIFGQLTDNRKIKFKYNFCNKLEKLKAKQTIDAFIYIIDDLQKKINNEFLMFNVNKESQQIDNIEKTSKVKHIKIKKEFKDFFNPDINIEVIEKIQRDFKDYIGKKMAYLIYILETDLKIISYSLNSKNDSRKHFVESLINKTISMQGINKHFEPNDVKLNVYRFENDYNYINTKEKLLKTIK